MSIFDGIEKLITEHGSAAILSQQLEFVKGQFSDLERKVSELQTERGRLEAQLERERLDHQQTQRELQRLKDEHAEEVRIHCSIEFRRGKRTSGKWDAFCPKCHMPVCVGDHFFVCSDGNCGWCVGKGDKKLSQLISELSS